jgi:peptidoglycan/LPS O-acetylase OafA/YrhL
MADTSKQTRFVYVDALRGIAALAVVLLHLYHSNMVPQTGYRFPQPLHAIFDNGTLGVYIFFVISGFVIAQSIHGERITPRFVGNFALRRSIRLDPPYWVTIIAMIALSYISNHMQHQRVLPMPTPAAVAAHVVYAQKFFGYPNIVGVFWTLCYEVQFYLMLVLMMGATQRLVASGPAVWWRSRWTIALPVWIFALICASGRLPLTEAFAIYCWPYFFLGVAVNWAHHNDIKPLTVGLLFAGSALALLFVQENIHYQPEQIAMAILTAGSIFAVSRAGKLATWTLGRALQYLGRISYSLYLVHMLLGTPSMRFGIRLLGKQPTFGVALGLMIISTAISIVTAHVMYVLVERPATRFSKRFRVREAARDQVFTPPLNKSHVADN